jgi:hypothetical protein
MPEGGIIYFHVSKDGKSLDDETVSDLSNLVKTLLHKLISDHFKAHAPDYVEHFQVEFNDYGSLIDFAASKKPEAFHIPDLTSGLRKHNYVVSFDRFEPEEEDNNNEDAENENNAHNGGAVAVAIANAVAHRRIRSPRRSLRRVRKTYRKRATSRKHKN